MALLQDLQEWCQSPVRVFYLDLILYYFLCFGYDRKAAEVYNCSFPSVVERHLAETAGYDAPCFRFRPFSDLELLLVVWGHLRRMTRKQFIDSRNLSLLIPPTMTASGTYIMYVYKMFFFYITCFKSAKTNGGRYSRGNAAVSSTMQNNWHRSMAAYFVFLDCCFHEDFLVQKNNSNVYSVWPSETWNLFLKSPIKPGCFLHAPFVYRICSLPSFE